MPPTDFGPSQFGTISPIPGASSIPNPTKPGSWLTVSTQPGPNFFKPVSFGASTASIAPPPSFMPQGAVSNWGQFMQGLLGTGVQYLLQKDAEKRATKLQAQGVPAEVVQHPDGGFYVQEKKSFFATTPGIIAIIGVGAVVLFLIARRK